MDARDQSSLRRWMKTKAKEVGGQSQFAKLSELSQPLVNQFLNGRKMLGENALATLAATFPEAIPYIYEASRLPYGTTPAARLIATIAELLDPEQQITLLQIAIGLHKVGRRDAERALSVEEYEALLHVADEHPSVTDDVLDRAEEEEPTRRDRTLANMQ